MTAPEILTFGCRLNAYESEVMRGHATSAGLSDTVVLNSCAVTAEAERQVRQAIRRVRRERPDARIVVTGCAAQIDPERYAAMEEVDNVIGNNEKLRAGTWTNFEDAPRISVNDIMALRETAPHLIAGFKDRVRAFVEIQQGCDHRCTFCIIPFGRGNNRSVPIGVIVDQARILVEQGYRELVLTGVDITDYGKDLPGAPPLGDMVKRLLCLVPDLPRLRLSSIDPAKIDKSLLDLIADEPRFMPHLHVSLQSGDNLILKRMKRRHCVGDVVNFVTKVRSLRPETVFGADIIAGFPTETDEAFTRSVSLVEEIDLTWLHVFPYSERPGTPASKMPQLPIPLRKSRANILRAAGSDQVTKFLEGQIKSRTEVLVEQNGQGRSPQFAKVQIKGSTADGEIISAQITGREDETLLARKTA
ncbi:MAG: tRNA (N(6)-L-threonylcarbamoyladenosine(37)-C(2))-methylthiotransferase MtaB [Pseudomonadota bacterium]|nr:tRNA (N(6)-L-threonylcarbamoyladenosine(37)-C(2))-methylthiotransferase MtaB [Pseudomonadota bacterium]